MARQGEGRFGGRPLCISHWKAASQLGESQGEGGRGSGSTNCRAVTNDGTFQNRNNVVMKGASLIAQLVKNLAAIQETRVQFLDWDCPLEKEMATRSRILAWRIP